MTHGMTTRHVILHPYDVTPRDVSSANRNANLTLYGHHCTTNKHIRENTSKAPTLQVKNL